MKAVFFIKGKVFAIKASIITILVTICGSAILYFNLSCYTVTFFTSLLLGICGSAFVTLIIYSVEYYDLKIKTLEHFYDECFNVIYKFLNIKYLYIKEPIDLVDKYYYELDDNKLIQTMLDQMPVGSKLPDDVIYQIKDTAKKALEDYIRPEFNELPFKASEEMLQEIVSENVIERMEKLKNEINNIIDQYSELNKMSLESAYKAYGQICFLLSNKKNRNEKIYEFLLEPQKEILHEIHNTSYYLEFYRNGESYNLPVVIDYILKLQNSLFREELSNKWHKIYNDYFYKMSERLEIFRASIYQDEPNTSDQKACIAFYYDN